MQLLPQTFPQGKRLTILTPYLTGGQKILKATQKKINDVFTVRFGQTSITVEVVELMPYQKILWRVIDCYKHWLKDKKEWNGTTMSWEIATEKKATQIRFTHVGLVPGIECYNGCEKAWNFYIKESLLPLFTGGKGMPELK